MTKHEDEDVERVARAIQDAYETFDLSTFSKLDERFWPEAAKAAINALLEPEEPRR